MNTPTPRTDAAWSATFDGQQMSAGQTARALRECSQQLETELAALTAERDQLRVDLELADVMYQRECEVEHELRTEVERLRSDRDCEKRLRKDADEFMENAIERAVKAEAELATATEECKNVRLKWHAVMGTCSAKEDVILESDEELARLEAELEKVYALVTPVGFDLPGGIFETAQAVTELRAERDQLRADRTYNHECINRLASATGTLGENSEKVVDVVLSTIAQLHAEVNEAHAATHHWCNRAERAEADLAKERARLDWLESSAATELQSERGWIDRAAIDAAMKEGA